MSLLYTLMLDTEMPIKPRTGECPVHLIPECDWWLKLSMSPQAILWVGHWPRSQHMTLPTCCWAMRASTASRFTHSVHLEQGIMLLLQSSKLVCQTVGISSMVSITPGLGRDLRPLTPFLRCNGRISNTCKGLNLSASKCGLHRCKPMSGHFLEWNCSAKDWDVDHQPSSITICSCIATSLIYCCLGIVPPLVTCMSLENVEDVSVSGDCLHATE